MNPLRALIHTGDFYFDPAAYALMELETALSGSRFLIKSEEPGPWQSTYRVNWIGGSAWIGMEVGREAGYLSLEDTANLGRWAKCAPGNASAWFFTNHRFLEPLPDGLLPGSENFHFILLDNREEISPRIRSIIGEIGTAAETAQHEHFFRALESVLKQAGLSKKMENLFQSWREVPLHLYLGKSFQPVGMPASLKVTSIEQEMVEKSIYLLGGVVNRCWSGDTDKRTLMEWIEKQAKNKGIPDELAICLLEEAEKIARQIADARAGNGTE